MEDRRSQCDVVICGWSIEDGEVVENLSHRMVEWENVKVLA